jgi:calcineurin-like phosphoesterase family protein
MGNVFLISDTHFSHTRICKFVDADGVKTRPFDDPTVMDETMVSNWNSVVKPTDKVYHLGDVVINRKALPILDRLNGKKVLIKGNHDIFKLSDYVKYFYDIRAYHKLDRFLMSHIPMHPDSLGRFHGQVHGHLHRRSVGDPRYFSVCVEQHNFTPVPLEVAQHHFQQLQS